MSNEFLQDQIDRILEDHGDLKLTRRYDPNVDGYGTDAWLVDASIPRNDGSTAGRRNQDGSWDFVTSRVGVTRMYAEDAITALHWMLYEQDADKNVK